MKIKNIVMYVLTVMLLIFYVGVLYLSMDLRQTEMYKKYYITRELKYYLTQEEFERDYTVNRELEYNSNGAYKNAGRGWDTVKEDGMWAISNDTSFYIYIENVDNTREYTLQIKVDEDMGYSNELYVNKKGVGVYHKSGDTYSMKLDSTMLVNGTNEFTLHTDETLDLDSDIAVGLRDAGELNMHVKSICLRCE